MCCVAVTGGRPSQGRDVERLGGFLLPPNAERSGSRYNSSRDMTENATKLVLPPADDPLQVHFALVLSRLIETAQADQAQLRHTVYELARIKLREEFRSRDDGDIARLAAALDGAIEGLECCSEGRVPEPRWQSALSGLAAPDDVVPPFVVARTLLQGDVTADAGREAGAGNARPRDPVATARGRRLSQDGSTIAGLAVVGRLVLIGALVVVSGAVAVNWSRLHRAVVELRGAPAVADAPLRSVVGQGTAPEVMPQTTPASAAPAGPGFPLPTSFGVYAIDADRLVELKALPGRVPDPRVAISAAIAAPSDAHLASSRPRFVVFRRDLVANVPDAVQLRIIAKVKTAMAGRRDTTSAAARDQDVWVIRNISFPYRAAPIEGQSEMVMIQPEADDRPLPAGRYALVIKGQAYDLSIDGPVTDPQQCLERVNATNGMFYMPCPGG